MGEQRVLPGPIAMVTGRYPMFSMTFVDREIRGLRASGCEVETFSLHRTRQECLSGAFQHSEAEQVISLFDAARRLPELFAAMAAALRHPRRLLTALCLAVATGRAGGPGLIRQTAYMAAALVLARRLRQRRIFHVHNHLGDSSGTVAMLAAELAGLPFSMTLHGPEIFEEAQRWDLNRKIARASLVACVTRFCRARAMLHSQPEHWPKLEVIRCGVEHGEYTVSSAQTNGSRLLFVGRLEVRKGISILVEALSLLRSWGQRPSLTIIGEGPERPAVEKLIAAAGLGDCILLGGMEEEAGVARAMADADIVVVPSLAEGLPVVIMEAMAAGLSVVASAVDGIPELVVNGETGLSVPAADPCALAVAIGRLMSDPDLRLRLGMAGRQRVRREHDAGRNARRLLELIIREHAVAYGACPEAADDDFHPARFPEAHKTQALNGDFA